MNCLQIALCTTSSVGTSEALGGLREHYRACVGGLGEHYRACAGVSLLLPEEGSLCAFQKIYFHCVHVSVFSGCMHVLHMCAWCPGRSEEGSGFLGIGVTGGCEPTDVGAGASP